MYIGTLHCTPVFNKDHLSLPDPLKVLGKSKFTGRLGMDQSVGEQTFSDKIFTYYINTFKDEKSVKTFCIHVFLTYMFFTWQMFLQGELDFRNFCDSNTALFQQ